MTADEKRLFHYKWDRFQKTQERIYTVMFKKALKEQVNQYVMAGYITSAPIYNVLLDLYKKVGVKWAHATQVGIKRQVKARQPMGFNERIVDLMKQYYGIDLLNDAEGITDYTREVIARVLSDAALSGASLSEQVDALLANSELSAMRARRIARTETVTAANGAAVINATELNLPMKKIWLSIHDRRTRHAHVLADNETVLLNDPFSVGGELLGQPGVRVQTNGLPTSTSNTVNCRCTCAFEVIE